MIDRSLSPPQTRSVGSRRRRFNNRWSRLSKHQSETRRTSPSCRRLSPTIRAQQQRLADGLACTGVPLMETSGAQSWWKDSPGDIFRPTSEEGWHLEKPQRLSFCVCQTGKMSDETLNSDFRQFGLIEAGFQNRRLRLNPTPLVCFVREKTNDSLRSFIDPSGRSKHSADEFYKYTVVHPIY